MPLKALVNKFAHMRFEPSGFTNNPNIRMAKSIVDYVFRWMGMKFLGMDAQRQLGINLDEAEAMHDVDEGLAKVERTDRKQRCLIGRSLLKTTLPLVASFGNRAYRHVRQSVRRAGVRNVRLHDGAQRRLLQVPQLWCHKWM